MLVANQRLRHGNQILAGIMSLSKSILGEKNVQMTLPKKIFLKVFFCEEILLAGAAVLLINSHK